MIVTAISGVLILLVVLAFVDVATHTVPNSVSLLATAGVVWIAAAAGISPQQWLGGILAALIVFLFYLELHLDDFFGGGDVKIAIVPAFALGIVSPLIALWWVSMAIAIQSIFSLTNRALAGDLRRHIPLAHLPAMAVAFSAAGAVASLAAAHTG